MKKIISAVLLFATTGLLQAQAPASFEKQELISGSDTLRYRILCPVNYRPEKKYPLIVFLHGSGERGSDNELQLKHGGKLFAREDIRNNHPAIVIFPQCPKDSAWSRFKRGQKMNEWIYDATLTATTPALLVKKLMDHWVAWEPMICWFVIPVILQRPFPSAGQPM